MDDTYRYKSDLKNSALCRQELDTIRNGNYSLNGFEKTGDISFFKILGNTNGSEIEDQTIYCQSADILSSFIRTGVSFVFGIVGDESGIGVYAGTLPILKENLISSFIAEYPGIEIEQVAQSPFIKGAYSYGGYITGVPDLSRKTGIRPGGIDKVIRAMSGKKFSYFILAIGMNPMLLAAAQNKLVEEMDEVFSLITHSITGGVQGNISVTKQDTASKVYYQNLESLLETIQIARTRGMWRVNGYYSAETPADSRTLANTIKAAFSGKESKPEPLRAIEYNDIKKVIGNCLMVSDLSDGRFVHPLGLWKNSNGQDIFLYIYQFQTLMTSDQLGVLARIPAEEAPGFYINQYVNFDVACRNTGDMKNPIAIGSIVNALNHYEINPGINEYKIEKEDFTRHALIIGVTGGGKTNTAKSILNKIWCEKGIPFLVIESAKREYWELRNISGFEDLTVYTLGAEAKKTSVSYRINPFETFPGLSLQTHIDYLLSTFKAAFDMVPPMPYVLEQAVYAVYTDRGWDIAENSNSYGFTLYPTLEDLHDKISVIVDELGYQDEMQANIRAALEARIKSLMVGGKGSMLNTPRSIPIQSLLSKPVIFELEDLGDDEVKSFVIGILMVQLYEYRKSLMDRGKKDLSHILMIEEAHRILKNPGNTEGTQARSVEFFCNMLAEIRTFGQGIIIADQIPTKIAPESIKNTNLKIVHRTVSQDDREAIGYSMNMTEEQIAYLSTLKRGYAAVYSEGDNRPKLVKFPLIIPQYNLFREQVIGESKKKSGLLWKEYRDHEDITLTEACSFCESKCQYYESINSFLSEVVDISKVLSIWRARDFSPQTLAAFVNSPLVKTIYNPKIMAQLCLIGQILKQDELLSCGERKKILADYLKSGKSEVNFNG